jgi:lipocalin
VLATGPNYEWALVGSPNHKTLWVLSRTATLPAETYQQIVSQAAAQGFKTAKLLTVTHHPGRSAISASGVAPPKVTPAAAENPK